MFCFMHLGHTLTQGWWPSLEGEVVRTAVPRYQLSGCDIRRPTQGPCFSSQNKGGK